MDTIETFKPVYQRFLESGMTDRDFCKSSNLPESRFYYWQAIIRKEAIQQSGNFIPVSINYSRPLDELFPQNLQEKGLL